MEYRTRVILDTKHAQDEQSTRAAFKACPSCNSIFEMERGCGYTKCSACEYRFCSRCLIPWVGKHGAYLVGKRAHLEGCLYRTRDVEGMHGLKRRFEVDEWVEERILLVKEVKRMKASNKEEAG